VSLYGVPRPVSLGITGVGLAAGMWGVDVLMPDGGDAAIVAGGVAVVLLLWHAVKDRRQELDADARARVLLAHPATDLWSVPGAAAVLAVACLVAAVVRDDAAGALPAVPLVLWALLAAVLLRRALRLAEQRLAGQDAP
jgi:nitrogen fixation-related uncharacterized protein